MLLGNGMGVQHECMYRQVPISCSTFSVLDMLCLPVSRRIKLVELDQGVTRCY